MMQPMALGQWYDGQVCSIARALEVVGERWTLLIVRDVFFGLRRFDQLQADLGLARNVLQSRLERLVDEGIIERHPYQQRPVRYEYDLTAAGRSLWPTLVALMQWGDAHRRGDQGIPVLLVHRRWGARRRLGPADVRPAPGPGAGADHPLHRLLGQRDAEQPDRTG